MRKNLFIISAFILLTCTLCACSRTGEKDSIDFIYSMAEYGYDLSVKEIASTQEIKESFYTDGCKITLLSDTHGRLYRLVLTFSDTAPKGFLELAKSCIRSFCGADETLTATAMQTLGITAPLPVSTVGIRQCESVHYLFSFTTDKAGGCLIIDNLRLNPTSSPTVTIRTTVPKIESAEESTAP